MKKLLLAIYCSTIISTFAQNGVRNSYLSSGTAFSGTWTGTGVAGVGMNPPQTISTTGTGSVVLAEKGVMSTDMDSQYQYLMNVASITLQKNSQVFTSGTYAGALLVVPGANYNAGMWRRDVALSSESAPEQFTPQFLRATIGYFADGQAVSGATPDTIGVN